MDTTNGYAPTEKMLDPTALAEMLRISDRHLTDVRKEDKTFPAPKLLGTLPRWSPAAIRRWMNGDAGATSCACTDGQSPHHAPAGTKPPTATPAKRKVAPRV
jgi:predicted DNA-binding transcriptional regulator AlpA